ncbi:hypothetical protein QR97_15065 [Streptomyces sp. PBH53]|uniref:hypothetical protein n=1 Tax=Streptomyces sp. PBH53 TaxID=1577075 RepID=UPI00065594E5|nr:hypothetical protein [Streptomyces sp. PBH53]AKN70960.1 hypothetical protein QR97_15065 [Streptomyces sp. PBH53]
MFRTAESGLPFDAERAVFRTAEPGLPRDAVRAVFRTPGTADALAGRRTCGGPWAGAAAARAPAGREP